MATRHDLSGTSPRTGHRQHVPSSIVGGTCCNLCSDQPAARVEQLGERNPGVGEKQMREPGTTHRHSQLGCWDSSRIVSRDNVCQGRFGQPMTRPCFRWRAGYCSWRNEILLSLRNGGRGCDCGLDCFLVRSLSGRHGRLTELSCAHHLAGAAPCQNRRARILSNVVAG
jgi:hypothetical protein